MVPKRFNMDELGRKSVGTIPSKMTQKTKLSDRGNISLLRWCCSKYFLEKKHPDEVMTFSSTRTSLSRQFSGMIEWTGIDTLL